MKVYVVVMGMMGSPQVAARNLSLAAMAVAKLSILHPGEYFKIVEVPFEEARES